MRKSLSLAGSTLFASLAVTAFPHAPEAPTAAGASIAGEVRVEENNGPVPGQDAVVYLESVDASLWRPPDAPAAPHRVEMRDKRFTPRVLAVLAGQSIDFPNQDPVFHNVFSLSGENRFDLGLYKDGASKAQVLAKPGIVKLYCNIHPSMAAYILVLQNPWFTQVGKDGRFSLTGVPPGSYTLRVWHERGGERSRSVQVTAGESLEVAFELDGRKFKVLPHKNKEGKDYPKRPRDRSSGY